VGHNIQNKWESTYHFSYYFLKSTNKSIFIIQWDIPLCTPNFIIRYKNQLLWLTPDDWLTWRKKKGQTI